MCLGTNISRHSHVWAQSYLGTNICGHQCVRAQTSVGTNVSWHKSVWTQTCVRTNVSGHKREGTVVWAQSCMSTNVVEPGKRQRCNRHYLDFYQYLRTFCQSSGIISYEEYLLLSHKTVYNLNFQFHRTKIS